jgi:xanthosine utilization system XapX-like protein
MTALLMAFVAGVCVGVAISVLFVVWMWTYTTDRMQ